MLLSNRESGLDWHMPEHMLDAYHCQANVPSRLLLGIPHEAAVERNSLNNGATQIEASIPVAGRLEQSSSHGTLLAADGEILRSAYRQFNAGVRWTCFPEPAN